MFKRDESGYGSANSMTEIEPPEPDFTRIGADSVRLRDEFEVSELLMNSANGVLYQGKCLKSGDTVIFKEISIESYRNYSE